jgi:hypothetical protein
MRLCGRLASEAKHFLRIPQLREAIKGRPHRVKGISPAESFRDDIMRTDQLDNGAHGSTCNNTGPVDGWFEQHVLTTEKTVDFMRNRSALERNMNQVLLGLLDGF